MPNQPPAPPAPPEPTLCFVLKPPVAGRVKTRLAAEVGDVAALRAYRALVAHLFATLGGRWRHEVHFEAEPASAEALMAGWLGPDLPFFPQVPGDLGEKLPAVVEGAFERSAQAVVLLGGDCPYLDPETILETASALRDHDAVIGPADDGGYYLLALTRPCPGLFQNIDWGGSEVLAQTLCRGRDGGLSFHRLKTLEDVDDGASWRRALARFPGLKPEPAG